MSKELEALNNIAIISEILVEVSKSHIMSNKAINEIMKLGIGEIYFTLRQAITELEALKRYPTQEEVCEALGEYHLFDMVEYDKKTQTFYSGDTICYMGIDYQDKPIIIFDYELPPHLITLIGRFYEGLGK